MKKRKLGFFQSLDAAAKKRGKFIWRGTTLLGGKNPRVKAGLIAERPSKKTNGFIYSKFGLITDRGGVHRFGVRSELFSDEDMAVDAAIRSLDEYRYKMAKSCASRSLTADEYLM